MKKIYLLKKEADGLQTTLGEYESEQAASNAAIEMCGTDGSIFDYDIMEADVVEPRISSYEEACAALGKEPLDEPLMRSQGFRKYEIARRKLETIVAALNFETRQRALEKETNADNNTQTADTEPVSDVAQPAKAAMAEAAAAQELEPKSEEDLIIEIGPGLGTLTKFLLQKAKKVLCVELDKKMIKILNDRFSDYNNFELINEDILKVNLKKIIEDNKKTEQIANVKIVANLPYYITTPIIMKLLEEKLDIESITVMIQKEVADRLIEIPGGKNTGAITYTVYYYCESEKIIEVPNNSFIPEPDVTSEVIKMNLRKEPAVKIQEPKIMFMIIKSAFMQRRKTLLNALTNTKVFINKNEGLNILKKLNLNENIRAEELSIQDFANIAKAITSNR